MDSLIAAELDDSSSAASSESPLSKNYFSNKRFINDEQWAPDNLHTNCSFLVSICLDDANDAFIHDIIDLANKYHIVLTENGSLNPITETNTESSTLTSTKSESIQIPETTVSSVTTTAAQDKATSNESEKPTSIE